MTSQNSQLVERKRRTRFAIRERSLLRCMSPFLCRFSDACMPTPSTRADGRRRRSAKARNRGMRIADGAAGYGELALRGTVTMVDFWVEHWRGRPVGG